MGGEDTEALARAIYDARSEAVHGEAGVEAAPGLAQAPAGGASSRSSGRRDGSPLPELRARLDDEPAAPPREPPPRTARRRRPRACCARRPTARRRPPPAIALTRHGLLITDPVIPEGRVVLFAPLHGLALETCRTS